MQIKVDLHVHSCYSKDSLITPQELVFYAKKNGMDGIAVTDHDRLDSAIKIAKENEFPIIPGMEITSSDGHIVALRISEPIPKGLSAGETVDRIQAAGGLAVACHPLAFFKKSVGRHVSSKFNAVEVINASAFPFGLSVRTALRLALNLGLAQVAGTDAHYGPQIGYAYTLLDSELKVDNMIEAITKGQCIAMGKAIPWRLRLKKEFLTLRKNTGLENKQT